jgi:hypothetical protein
MTIRLHQGILVASVLVGSWFGMEAVHEFGHVVGAWLSGGRVVRVVLDPRTISRTDVDLNPQPLVEVWTGPILGVLLPILAWSLTAACGFRAAFVFRFFAGFCLIANGSYIGGGSFWRIGDCGVMLQNGSPLWQLLAFGIVSVAVGLWLWNRLAANFGFGREKRPVDATTAYACLAASILLVAACTIIDGR